MANGKFLRFIEIWKTQFGMERTLTRRCSTDAHGAPIPWYTYPAIEYLSQFDYADKYVFEYGCAASSLFWAKRAADVIGVEDKLVWFEKWQETLKAENLRIVLKSPDEYARAISETGRKFDVIIIDGIEREACAEAAVEALSVGGMIIFDDSDRANKSTSFAKALDFLKKSGLLQIDFYGFCPMSVYPKTTSVFFSRSFDFARLKPIQPACGIGSLWGCSRAERKRLYRAQLEEEQETQDLAD